MQHRYCRSGLSALRSWIFRTKETHTTQQPHLDTPGDSRSPGVFIQIHKGVDKTIGYAQKRDSEVIMWPR